MRKLFDGFEEGVGLCRAQAFFGGERAENGDSGAYAGAARHLQVFGGVADVDGVLRVETHAAEREFERRGMRLALGGVACTDARGESVPEVERF